MAGPRSLRIRLLVKRVILHTLTYLAIYILHARVLLHCCERCSHPSLQGRHSTNPEDATLVSCQGSSLQYTSEVSADQQGRKLEKRS